MRAVGDFAASKRVGKRMWDRTQED